MVNVKTPNKKRKSLANVGGDASTAQSPKGGKVDTNVKTPNKFKGNASPGKQNKTPKVNVQNNTLKQTPAKNQNQTPAKVQGENNSSNKSNKKNKRSSESENENSPQKKLKMFGGTTELEESPEGKKPQHKKGGAKPQKKKEKDESGGVDGKKKKGQFFNLRQKLNGDQKEAAVKDIEKKIKAFEDRKELTKTAKRKLKLLQKLLRVATGQKIETKPPSDSKKRRERKKQVKAKHGEGDENQPKQIQKVDQKQQKPTIKVETAVKEEGDSDSSESDYEVDAEIKPDKIIKTSTNVKEDEDDSDADEEEESGEDEEESGEEEEEEGDSDEDDEFEEEELSPSKNQKGKKIQPKKGNVVNLNDLKENDINKKQSRYIVFVGNLPYDATRQEISEHFQKAGEVRHIRIPLEKQTNKPRGFAYVEFHDETAYQKALSLHHTFIKGRRINVLYTQGGKKKAEDKKNEIKTKNLKLQAMRKQGQLVGSVKENQKRSARRAKKGQVNGA